MDQKRTRLSSKAYFANSMDIEIYRHLNKMFIYNRLDYFFSSFIFIFVIFYFKLFNK